MPRESDGPAVTSGQSDIGLLLERLATELASLEKTGLEIENSVGELIAAAPPRASTALQELDRLVQRLRDLAAISAVIAKAEPTGKIPNHDAAAAMRLQHSRSIFLGWHGAETSDNVDELFF